jgi:hypothetical protein
LSSWLVRFVFAERKVLLLLANEQVRQKGSISRAAPGDGPLLPDLDRLWGLFRRLAYSEIKAVHL